MRLTGGWLALTLVACAPSASTQWGPLDPLDSRPFGAAKRAVLLREWKLDFHQAGGEAVADVTDHFRGAVLADTAERWSQAKVEYERGFSEALSLRARVVRPYGTVELADPEKQVEIPVAGQFVLYSDEVALVQPTPVPAVGDIWESESVLRTHRPRLSGFAFPLRDGDPIAQLRLTVHAPTGWEVETGWRNGPPVPLEPEVLPDGSTRLHLELSDLPALTREPLSAPEPPELLVRLKRWSVGSGPRAAYRDPAELSRDVWQMMRGADASSPEIDAAAQQIASSAGPDPEARASAASRWVCERIQYCAIEIGSGGWIPHPAAEVQRQGYGDCKDKAMLLHVLLGRLGVTSDLAALFAHKGFPRPFGLPTLGGNFNHVILRVALPGREVLTDPTAEFVPFGELPATDLSADLLPITEAGAALQRTPERASADDVLISRLALGSASPAGGTASVTMRGLPASRWRAELAELARERHGQLLCRWLGTESCDASRLDERGVEKGATELSLIAAVRLGRAVERSGSFATMRASGLGDWGFDAPQLPRRTQAVLLGAPWREEQEVEVEVGKSEVTLPSSFEQDAGFARYQLTWTSAGGKLTMRRSLELRQASLPAARYDDFRVFVDALREAEARAAVWKTEAGR